MREILIALMTRLALLVSAFLAGVAAAALTT
jgi:hypothetical protein